MLHVVHVLLLLFLVTTTVTAIPIFGHSKLKVSGIPLYHDLGKYAYGGLLGGIHGSGLCLYNDLWGNGYNGLQGFGKYASGIGLYGKLGSGIFGMNGLKHLGPYAGAGSMMFGDYGHQYGVLTGKHGPYGNYGVPFGTLGHGNLVHGMVVSVVPKGGVHLGYTY